MTSGSDRSVTNEEPQPGRVYFALLGAKGPFRSDIAVAKGIEAEYGAHGLNAKASAWSARHCAERMVYDLAAHHGVDQFLDVGCGLPLEPDIHQIARHESSDVRVVLVDNDPIVADHWDVELSVSPADHVRFLAADMTDPESVLNSPQVTEMLDLSRPVGLLFNNILPFVPDTSRPHDVVARYVEVLAPGSYMTLNHPTGDVRDMGRVADVYNGNSGDGPLHLRDRESILRFFDGMELLAPGLVMSHSWRPDILVPHIPGTAMRPHVDSLGIDDISDSKWAAVARKPA
ncbi:SAM-dependent methyltransferase [Streptomyces sp. NPDC048506]|uniref:SAM-dependent methyltransferase n=1 Tax=Streptomyces sp. NPDC048506 TaxID=3155028 RepID=UPI00342E0100